MSNTPQPQQLMMLRREAPVPALSLQPGWTVRPMSPQEGAVWAGIIVAAGFFTDDSRSPEDLWQGVMGKDPGVKTENVFFACDPEGTPVATAAARFIVPEERGKFPPTANALGCLHYVAARPEGRGMGAGAAVTTAVLQRNEQLGLPDCILTTDDFRLAAIKIYLSLGWVPVLYAPDMRGRWQRVLDTLGIAGVRAVDGNGEDAAIAG